MHTTIQIVIPEKNRFLTIYAFFQFTTVLLCTDDLNTSKNTDLNEKWLQHNFLSENLDLQSKNISEVK